jgi:PTS system nitrogen regulatory IIA component
MRLADILTAERVTTALSARDKDDALRALAGLFDGISAEEVYGVLRDRENLASTGVGDGVAIPHGRLAGIDRLQAALAICPRGVDFESIDGEPVHIFVAIVAPNRRTGDHLKALARVSRLLRREDLRARLRKAESASTLFEALLSADA